MRRPETEEGIPGVQFEGFEEAVVALGAVQDVMGEDHPLLNSPHPRELRGTGATLTDEIYRGDEAERQIFTGDDRRVILGALNVIADQTSSRHHLKAGLMLERPAAIRRSEAIQATVQRRTIKIDPLPSAASHKEPEATPAPKILRYTPPEVVDGEVVGGHLEIPDTATSIAAYHAVLTTEGPDHPLVRPQTRANGAPVNLYEALDRMGESFLYWGDDARTIYRALRRAAVRHETIHDETAARLLEKGMIVAENLPAPHAETAMAAIAA